MTKPSHLQTSIPVCVPFDTLSCFSDILIAPQTLIQSPLTPSLRPEVGFGFDVSDHGAVVLITSRLKALPVQRAGLDHNRQANTAQSNLLLLSLQVCVAQENFVSVFERNDKNASGF